MFKSRAVLLSNGAHQILHPLFYKEWFPTLDQSKVVLSDEFLKMQKYKEVMSRIKG